MYTIRTEPCKDRFRAIVSQGGHIVYTTRGRTHDEAHTSARQWITLQTASPLNHAPQWTPTRRKARRDTK